MVYLQFFKRKVFDMLNENELNELFYYSLFDLSSEEEVPNHLKPERIEEKVISLLKSRCKEFYDRYVKRDKDLFLREFVFSDILLKHLLAIKLKKKGIKFGKGFPDISISNDSKTAIEVKRLISSSNLRERMKNEVVENLRLDSHGFDKFLLVLLFPILQQENPARINQLVEGYYYLEDYLKVVCKIEDCKVLCQVVAKANQSPFNLEELVGRILKLI